MNVNIVYVVQLPGGLQRGEQGSHGAGHVQVCY